MLGVSRSPFLPVLPREENDDHSARSIDPCRTARQLATYAQDRRIESIGPCRQSLLRRTNAVAATAARNGPTIRQDHAHRFVPRTGASVQGVHGMGGVRIRFGAGSRSGGDAQLLPNRPHYRDLQP